MKNIKDIKGVIPAMITVFDKNEQIDEKATRGLVNHLLKKKIDGLYLTGSTGEGFLMTPEERKQYVEIVIDEVKGEIPIIVHIGAIGTKISVELAEHAYKHGADALSSVPPFYWRFNGNNIYQYYKDIADATPLPMIVYNVPLAGMMGAEVIEKIVAIENVKGIKYTATTHQDMSLIKDKFGQDFMVYSGCDEMALSGLQNGADGIIGSFYNLMPEMFVDIYNCFISGDLAEANIHQQNALRLIDYTLGYEFMSLMKAGLTWMGVEAGYCRRPFINVTEEEIEKAKLGFKAMRDQRNITNVDFLNAL